MKLNRRQSVALLAAVNLALLVIVGCLTQQPRERTEDGSAANTAASDPHASENAAAPASVDESGAAVPRSTGGERTVRIGAWNIEWLGTPGSRSGVAKNVAQKPDALAAYIEAARVDVLALSEIATTDDGPPPTNETLRDAFALIDQRTGSRWRHVLLPARSGRNQNTGIAWNERVVQPIGKPVLLTPDKEESGQDKPLWSRPAYGQLFSAGDGKTDFLVIPIHMKSDYGGKFDAHRADEARELVSQLPSRVTDGDIIIIGDSNADTHDEPAIGVLAGPGLADLNNRDVSTHVRYGALDRVFIPVSQPEFKGRVFEVLSDEFRSRHGLSSDDFKRYYSDHYMVITSIAIGADDDK
ncbi:MAG: endonuclease/exonuclease/phosphatase family protein [Phycisphaerae bacterium]